MYLGAGGAVGAEGGMYRFWGGRYSFWGGTYRLGVPYRPEGTGGSAKANDRDAMISKN